MKNYRPIYRDIKDWAILDEQIIHDYTENENPISVVELLIGTLHYESIDFNQHYIEKRTPIIRWLSKKEYEYLCANEGTIIW